MAFRLAGPSDLRLDAIRASVPDAISAAAFVDGYLNLELAPTWLAEFVSQAVTGFASWHPRRGTQWHIEHTSLNPVYPLNLATFRSTCLGDFARLVLEASGCRVVTRYWVQDLARQVDLVKSQIPQALEGERVKQDHLVGASFAMLVLEGRVSPEERERRILQMFPQVDVRSLRSRASSDLGNREASEYCLEGIVATLDLVGARVDRFDFESDLLATYPPEDLYSRVASMRVGSKLIPLLKEDSSLPTYLVRNIAYYFELMRLADVGVSVVPARQRDVLESARAYALALHDRPAEDLHLVYYGDVVAPRGEPDAISEGRFSAVDDALEAFARQAGDSLELVTAGLKLAMLAAASSRTVRIGTKSADILRRPRRWQAALDRTDAASHGEVNARPPLIAAVAAISELQQAAVSLNSSGLVRAADRLADALTESSPVGEEHRDACRRVLHLCRACLVGEPHIEGC